MATALENTGPVEFVDSITGLPKPPVGLEVSSHVLIEFTPQKPAGDGSYAYGLGIFRNLSTDPLAYHKFVVWTLILRPGGGWEQKVWVAESGDYCRTLTDAVQSYERRGGKI